MAKTEVVEQAGSEGAAAPTPSGEPTSPETPPKEGETPTIPKPRFDEVIAERNAVRAERDRLHAEAQALRAQQAQAVQAQAQQIPTLEQVLDAYNKGEITEDMKDRWVHYHSKETAKREFGQIVAQTAIATHAQGTVREYVKAYPNLSNMASEEFKGLADTYGELLMGGQPDSLATQAMALRMTFGPLKRLAETPGSPSPRADTFVEGTGGGGSMSRTDDPLKDVSERQKAYWKSKGYTKAQMAQEAALSGIRSITDYRRVAGKPKKP